MGFHYHMHFLMLSNLSLFAFQTTPAQRTWEPRNRSRPECSPLKCSEKELFLLVLGTLVQMHLYSIFTIYLYGKISEATCHEKKRYVSGGVARPHSRTQASSDTHPYCCLLLLGENRL